MNNQMLHIERDDVDGVAVVVLRGEVDIATVAELREALIGALGDAKRVLVDMQALDFIDSSGIGILIGGLKRARADGGELELVCSGKAVLRTFEITGLDSVFTIHDSRDAALA